MSLRFPWTNRLLLLTAALTLIAASASAQTYSNLEQGTGWVGSSSVAVGPNGGITRDFSLTKGVRTPSMDGASARFFLGGSQPFTNAIWWKPVVQNTTASHFVYDLYLYMTNPNASQALEFSANQTVNGKRYKFSTQCAFNRGVWRLYNPSTKSWVATSAPCTRPLAYKWNHVTLEYARANGRAQFISVTFNGKKSYLNKSLAPYAVNDNKIYIHFQMDGNRNQDDYSVWLDKVSLRVW